MNEHLLGSKQRPSIYTIHIPILQFTRNSVALLRQRPLQTLLSYLSHYICSATCKNFLS
ncbi:hypothetical protein SLEP1_g10989 [Rubroshorea leprosula]|uniref:Uncharacterized protein n=1 Tax=Rubroshorea leprosula TaxID=152421 RepID=A0AAV5IKN5_9ROSI|nr:hypothetical protein SLEP1_g10989 [Rubroshorea leprosula]